ncbi:hypothetical protein GCM10022197_04070 [Microlunatus spumicola]|uniref:Lipoprotein n=2 Tax=Microlunatus spumicola TaxID=81499 RepID=A0ABP6WL40_9ACTN
MTSGCSVQTGLPSGDRAAKAELKRLQVSVFNEASSNFRRGFDPVVLARWATNDSGTSPQGAEDHTPFDDLVEALSWSSTDGADGVVDLRMSVTTIGYEDHTFGGESYGPGSAQRCVRIHVGSADESVVTVDCGGRTPVAVPAAAKPAGPLDEKKLLHVMGGKSLPAIEAAARKAFPTQSVTASTLDGYWVVVVVREAPDLACMGGSRDPDGKVKVSTAPRIRPGEGDCGADRFVYGPVYGH